MAGPQSYCWMILTVVREVVLAVLSVPFIAPPTPLFAFAAVLAAFPTEVKWRMFATEYLLRHGW